jgi:hypothetical protein
MAKAFLLNKDGTHAKETALAKKMRFNLNQMYPKLLLEAGDLTVREVNGAVELLIHRPLETIPNRNQEHIAEAFDTALMPPNNQFSSFRAEKIAGEGGVEKPLTILTLPGVTENTLTAMHSRALSSSYDRGGRADGPEI